MALYQNIKNRKTYNVINQHVYNATNGQEKVIYVLYQDRLGQLYCREKGEFLEKFTQITNS